MLVIVFIGLLSYKTEFVYYIGLIFFIAGVFFELYVPYFGLVFLFSHGLTGLGVMISGLCGSVFNLFLTGDASIGIYIICAVSVLIFIAAFIMGVLYNISNNFKSRMYAKNIIFLLFIIGLLIVGILPYIIKYI